MMSKCAIIPGAGRGIYFVDLCDDETHTATTLPVYDYYCDANDRTVEVTHPIDVRLEHWGQLCYVAQIPMGDTDPLAPVRKVITSPPGVSIPISNSELKNVGFTKLVRRDDGVFENVTATGDEKRYVVHDDPASMPHLEDKVGD